MCFSTAMLRIHATGDIKQLVILLYIKYSKFFCHLMTWYLGSHWSRIKTALRNDFYTKEVKQKVMEINDITKRIERQALLISQRQAQISDERHQRMHEAVKSLLEKTEHQDKTLEHAHEKLDVVVQLLLGQLGHDQIAALAERKMHDADVADAIRECALDTSFDCPSDSST